MKKGAQRFLSVDPLAAEYSAWSTYNYVLGNPILFIDPDGKDAIVTIKGNVITISATIYIHGSGASKAMASLMQKDIMAAWGTDTKSGVHWFSTDSETGKDYMVEFEVTVKVFNEKDPTERPGLLSGKLNVFNRDNFIEVDNASTRSFVQGGDEGIWRGKGRGGRTLATDDSAPHEFGHILGFKDRYNPSGPHSGWAGNIMAEPAMKGVVEQKNIDALVKPLIEKYKKSNTNSKHIFKTQINHNNMQYEAKNN